MCVRMDFLDLQRLYCKWTAGLTAVSVKPCIVIHQCGIVDHTGRRLLTMTHYYTHKWRVPMLRGMAEYVRPGTDWITGTVFEVLGPVTYIVETIQSGSGMLTR